jgi:hypothetical protein
MKLPIKVFLPSDAEKRIGGGAARSLARGFRFHTLNFGGERGKPLFQIFNRQTVEAFPDHDFPANRARLIEVHPAP